MAITIEKEPANPLLAKNEIAYKVTTNDDAVEKIVAHLVIESGPYTDSWTILKKAEQAPNPDDSNSCWFFFHDTLDRILTYQDPPSAAAVVDTEGCRRVRVEFYEYKSTNRILKSELYSESHQILSIDEFNESSNYLLLIDYSLSNLTEANRVRIGNGINTTPNPDELTTPLAILDAWTQSSDTGYQLEKYSATGNNVGYSHIVVPKKTTVRVYLWARPATVLSEIRYAIKAGLDPSFFAEMTKDPDYWVDENLDSVIDNNGNLLNT